MRCDRCGCEIAAGDQRDHLGQVLCEDCYMDVLSPVKACDPWAIHCARSFEGQDQLTRTQRKIIGILEKNGGLSPDALLGHLGNGMTRPELEREFATLKHMNKVRAEKKTGGIVLSAC